MSRVYASATVVPVQRTLSELDKLVTKYGATGFAYGRDEELARVVFILGGRMLRFQIKQPKMTSVSRTTTGRARSEKVQQEALAAEERRLWRAIFLLVKALLVAVDEGIIDIGEAFLANTVLPDGMTMAEWSEVAIPRVIASGQMPSLLPGDQPRSISS